MPFLTTRKLTLVSDEYIRIQDQRKHFCTPHVIRNTMMPSFCKFEVVWPRYGLCKFTLSILWNAFLYYISFKFIMLYTGDFSMRHYVGFSQIGSHITMHMKVALVILNLWDLYVIIQYCYCVNHVLLRSCSQTGRGQFIQWG